MEMQKWLNARCAQLLADINNTPLTDDADDKKLQLIMAGMRESSVEMFHRAAERSRKDIQKINNQNMNESIEEINATLNEAIPEPSETKQEPKVKLNEKPKEKIKLTSSVIRRVDSF